AWIAAGAPAVAQQNRLMYHLLDRLKIQHKLALLCSAFLLPIAFLTYLFVAQTEKEAAVAAKEVEGSTYFAALKTELRTLIALSQGTASPADLAKAQAEVLTLDRAAAEAMAATDAALAMAAADRQTPEMTVRFLTRKGELTAALSGVDGDIASGERGNRDGTMKPALDAGYRELAVRSAAYAKLLEALAAPGGQL